jgi:rod shape-determining protein MreC
VAKSRRSRRSLTIVALVIISLSVISLDLNGPTHKITSGVKSVANSVFSPLRDSVVDLLSPIGNFFAGALHYHSVQNENEQLQATIGRLRTQASEKGYELRELREITALEHLPYLGSLQTVTAQAQEENSSNFSETITIGKGRADGVDVGMPVVGAGGLVGQVIQSFHHSSVVLLITDGQSRVGVTFGNGVIATADGEGPGAAMSADLVPLHTHLSKGEIMYTNGLDAASFPPGIPVARVTSSHTGAGASQETVNITPEANLSQLEYVDVVLWEPNP